MFKDVQDFLKLLLFTIILLVLKRNYVECNQNDPCQTALSLNSTLRSTENFVEDVNTSGFLCDRTFRNMWYRFQTWNEENKNFTDNKMPEECTSDYTCGTHSPIYLNGAYAGHPQMRENEATREVCASLNGNCCHQRWRIKIKNCGSYMVYKLPDVPGCFMAYCAN